MARLLDGIDSPRDLKRIAPTDLPTLCEEIRGEIVRVCAVNGGHLGSSLGAVELIVALHYVYASPVDRLVFDVGHQAYAHKLLTGRRERPRPAQAAPPVREARFGACASDRPVEERGATTPSPERGARSPRCRERAYECHD